MLISAAQAADATAAGEWQVRTDTEFDSLYQVSLEAFRAGRYADADRGFSTLLLNPHRRSEYLDNLYYWLGECRYADQAWLDAMSCFLKVLEFPWPGKEESARMKIALCWQNLNEPARACAEATTLKDRFPDGEYAARAERLMQLACGKGVSERIPTR